MESVENEKGNKRKDGDGLWVVWRSERWIKGDKESKETIIEQGRQILSETEQIEKRGESSTFLPSFLHFWHSCPPCIEEMLLTSERVKTEEKSNKN